MRLYAEDPRTFLPQAGRIERLRLPDGVRVDAGVEEGDEVGVGYDPMIAKLIAHGETRDEALAHLRAALAETEVDGTDDEPARSCAGWSPIRPCGPARRRRPSSRTTRRSRRRPASRDRVVARAWRLNLPAPAAGPAARTRAGRRTPTGRRSEESTLTAPDARAP